MAKASTDPDDRLLYLRAGNGQWRRAAMYETVAAARAAVDWWLGHCEATAWRAFEFRAAGKIVQGRFVGTKIRPTTRRAGKSAILGPERESRGG